jgi:hypothetical protein|nr:MAG TPA: hypothetical protein [Caudoviricetes sp.]
MEQINEGLKAKYDAYNATLKPDGDWTVEGQRLAWAAENIKKLDDLDKNISKDLVASFALTGTGRYTGRDSKNIAIIRDNLNKDLIQTILKGASTEAGYVSALKKVKKILDDNKAITSTLEGAIKPSLILHRMEGQYKPEEINLVLGGLYLMDMKGLEGSEEREVQRALQRMQGGAAISMGYKTIAAVSGKVKQYFTAARDALKSKYVIAEECTSGSFEAALNYVLVESAKRR